MQAEMSNPLLPDLQIEGHRTLFTPPYLELHTVSLVDVIELYSRGQAPPAEKYIVAAVIGGNEAETFLP
jgi:hypothetical protein